MKRRPTSKELAELYILFIEDSLSDIKRHIKEWTHDFSVEDIEAILTLPLKTEKERILFVNSHYYE